MILQMRGNGHQRNYVGLKVNKDDTSINRRSFEFSFFSHDCVKQNPFSVEVVLEGLLEATSKNGAGAPVPLPGTLSRSPSPGGTLIFTLDAGYCLEPGANLTFVFDSSKFVLTGPDSPEFLYEAQELQVDRSAPCQLNLACTTPSEQVMFPNTRKHTH
jgi:hypothetical protein